MLTFNGTKDLFSDFDPVHVSGAQEPSSKWVGKTKNFSSGSKKWVGKYPFSIKVKLKIGWAHAHPAHPASTPLYLHS